MFHWPSRTDEKADVSSLFSQTALRTSRLDLSRAISATAHLVLLYLLVRPAAPKFVLVSEVQKGEGGSSTYASIYLPRNGTEDLTPSPSDAAIPRHAARKKRNPLKPLPLQKQLVFPMEAAKPQPQRVEETPSVGKMADVETDAPRAGSIYGSLASGPLNGPEVKPALPIAGENPIFTRAQLPPGVEGSVIVEVTIDETGKIIGTKLVQSLGYGIDERVMNIVQQWKFKPATRDGVAIASQQLCVFHFPSGAG